MGFPQALTSIVASSDLFLLHLILFFVAALRTLNPPASRLCSCRATVSLLQTPGTAGTAENASLYGTYNAKHPSTSVPLEYVSPWNVAHLPHSLHMLCSDMMKL
jgi:hypothetical protein